MINFEEKTNSWRFGFALYYLMQCVIMIVIFFICRNKLISELDLSLKGSISHLVFIGSGFIQFIYVAPAFIIYWKLNSKRAAWATLVCSLIWLLFLYLLFQIGTNEVPVK